MSETRKMPRVFISTGDADAVYILPLIQRLRQEGFPVKHSPPPSGLGPEWESWYDKRLPETIAQTDIFIMGVTPALSCSTWLLSEAYEAWQNKDIQATYFFNPAHLSFPVQNFFTKEYLPDDVEAAVAVLKLEASVKGAEPPAT